MSGYVSISNSIIKAQYCKTGEMSARLGVKALVRSEIPGHAITSL